MVERNTFLYFRKEIANSFLYFRKLRQGYNFRGIQARAIGSIRQINKLNRMADAGIKDEEFMLFKTKIGQLAERKSANLPNRNQPTCRMNNDLYLQVGSIYSKIRV